MEYADRVGVSLRTVISLPETMMTRVCIMKGKTGMG